MSALPKPQLKGLFQSTLKRASYVAGVALVGFGVAFWYGYNVKRRKVYEDYDAWHTPEQIQKEFERMDKFGVFNCSNDESRKLQAMLSGDRAALNAKIQDAEQKLIKAGFVNDEGKPDYTQLDSVLK